MIIQLQPQHLTVLKLKLELLAVEPRIVPVDYPVVVGADDNDVRGIVVLRTGEIVDVMSLHHAVTILLANLLATNLVTIVVEFLKHADDAAVYLTILYQQLLLNHRGRLVCHEELVVIACLIHLLRNGVEGASQLLIVGIGTTLHAQHIAGCS